MDILQHQFLRAITDQHVGLIVDLFAQKAQASGINLSERQRKRIHNQLSQGQDINLNLQTWRWWERKAVEIQFTEEDIRNVDEQINEVIARMPEMVAELVDYVAQDLLAQLKDEWTPVRKQREKEFSSFNKRLRARWSRQLDALGMALELATDVGVLISDKSRTDPDNRAKNLTEVLTRLQARACQVTSEILVLVSHGYADGAMARWRTLHEIAVVGKFLAREGEDVAERYRLYDVVQTYKGALLYQEKYERLDFEPLSPKELDEAKNDYEVVCAKYGPEFAGEYGWAAAALRMKRPTFKDIEESVDLDHLRPYFKLASHGVHANPRGVFFKLGLASDDVLLVGPSDIGMGDPLHGAAISLTQITVTLFKLAVTVDVLVAAKIMLALADEIAEANIAMRSKTSSENEPPITSEP